MIDMRVTELLASRLCHDLVGPVGAVRNGMELLEDDEFDMAADALALASKSADQAANLLQFYRMAYGSAGGRQGGDLTVFRSLAEPVLAHANCELQWSDPAPGDTVPDSCGQILLNVIALAEECLPRGGTIATSIARDTEGFRIVVTAQGTDAALRDQSEAAMAPDVDIDDLTPRNVHGHFTALLARRSGGNLNHEKTGPDKLAFSIVLP